jgi:glycosyltransferase involved in cell wall biosynthesis
MATVPACSVVPTYNRAELLARTLDSLVRQDLPRAEFEVLVVDDGSSDHTAELAQSYRDRLDLRYFFQPDEGWRVAQARNVGIANARGAVCVMVDSGVLLHSGCLRAHLASQAGGPVAVLGYVYGFDCKLAEAAEMMRTLDFADPDASIARMHDTGRWIDVREPFYVKYADDISGLPAPWIVFWTCNASAPTQRLRAVGGFDEQFRSWGGEDIDLGTGCTWTGSGSCSTGRPAPSITRMARAWPAAWRGPARSTATSRASTAPRSCGCCRSSAAP